MQAGSALSPTKQYSNASKLEDEDYKRGDTNSNNNKSGFANNALQQKEFQYNDPGVKIGNGKFGPVNLIIHKGKLYALKIVPKTTIEKSKRIEHVKNEKAILHLLRKH